MVKRGFSIFFIFFSVILVSMGGAEIIRSSGNGEESYPSKSWAFCETVDFWDSFFLPWWYLNHQYEMETTSVYYYKLEEGSPCTPDASIDLKGSMLLIDSRSYCDTSCFEDEFALNAIGLDAQGDLPFGEEKEGADFVAFISCDEEVDDGFKFKWGDKRLLIPLEEISALSFTDMEGRESGFYSADITYIPPPEDKVDARMYNRYHYGIRVLSVETSLGFICFCVSIITMIVLFRAYGTFKPAMVAAFFGICYGIFRMCRLVNINSRNHLVGGIFHGLSLASYMEMMVITTAIWTNIVLKKAQVKQIKMGTIPTIIVIAAMSILVFLFMIFEMLEDLVDMEEYVVDTLQLVCMTVLTLMLCFSAYFMQKMLNNSKKMWLRTYFIIFSSIAVCVAIGIIICLVVRIEVAQDNETLDHTVATYCLRFLEASMVLTLCGFLIRIHFVSKDERSAGRSSKVPSGTKPGGTSIRTLESSTSNGSA